MAEYIPSPVKWVRDQVELYEGSGGTEGVGLRDTGLPCIIVTHTGNKTGSIRKTPLMRVKDGDSYVLVASKGGAPKNPEWVYNLRTDPTSSFGTPRRFRRCGYGRSRMPTSGPASGRWPWRRSHRTRTTGTRRPARSRCSSRSPCSGAGLYREGCPPTQTGLDQAIASFNWRTRTK